MFSENQMVTTPRGKGRIVYIEDDFVSVELSNGVEMDFDVSDLSTDIKEEVVEEKEHEWLNLPDGQRVHASVILEVMAARADGILRERHDVLKGHLRHISSGLGKAYRDEIQKVFDYAREQDDANCPLKVVQQDWKRELFLYSMFLGAPPSTLETLDKDEIKERYLAEMAGYLKAAER